MLLLEQGRTSGGLLRIVTMLRLCSTISRRAPVANRSFATIVDGVDFDTIAREWRFKWSPDQDKKVTVVFYIRTPRV